VADLAVAEEVVLVDSAAAVSAAAVPEAAGENRKIKY
jgi:hypothetical protein